MLRITRLSDVPVTLKLEGKLMGPWVRELRAACADVPGRGVRLDLAAVSYADAAGVLLLRDLLGRGAMLAGCSGLVAELLHAEGR
jgi:ABC-type transporter Mla MlaB component